MGTFISILIILVCILLILVVLIQNSKGGGLSSTFASSNQVMGVRKTADFLEKATWALAIALLVLCVSTSFFSKSKGEDKEAIESITRKKAESNVSAVPAPVAAPVATPPANPAPDAGAAPETKK